MIVFSHEIVQQQEWTTLCTTQGIISDTSHSQVGVQHDIPMCLPPRVPFRPTHHNVSLANSHLASTNTKRLENNEIIGIFNREKLASIIYKTSSSSSS